MANLILISGGLFSLVMVCIGAKLRYSQAYGLIAGYNTASPEKKKEYDIEGLSHHLGNGLMTMGVLLALGSLFAAWDRVGWCLGIVGLFVFVAMLTVVGGRKFMPNPPQPGDHRFLRAVLSERAFEAVQNGTRQWLFECSCGHKADLWEMGGVRFKAAGEPRQWTACQGCGKITWQKVRRKTAAERERVA